MHTLLYSDINIYFELKLEFQNFIHSNIERKKENLVKCMQVCHLWREFALQFENVFTTFSSKGTYNKIQENS
jgi:hypothetical protein